MRQPAALLGLSVGLVSQVQRLPRMLRGFFVEADRLVDERVHRRLDGGGRRRAGHRAPGGVRVAGMTGRRGGAVDADRQVGAVHLVVDAVGVLVKLDIGVVGRHTVGVEAHRFDSFG